MELTLGHIISVLAVMGGVVGTLWVAFYKRVNDSEKNQKAMIDSQNKQISLCEDRHVEKDKQFDVLRTKIDDSQQQILDLHGECRYLKGRQDAVEQFSARIDNSLGNIEQISKKVLAKVDNDNAQKKSDEIPQGKPA